MFEYILLVAIVISIIAFFKWLRKVSMVRKVLLVDKCDECPFMRQIDDEYSYICSARIKSKTFDSLSEMNELCEFGGKIEIKISEK